MIYLDNAATSFPKPQCVLDTVYSVQHCLGANPGRGGHRLSIRAGEKVFSCREKLASHFGCKSENVAFTCNCTSALNTAIKGITEKGDHIIISSLEHNSVLRPVHSLKQKGDITYSIAKVNPLDDNETLRNFDYHLKENTKAIIVTHVSNVFGTVLPIDKLSAYCKAKGIYFIVDAAQSAGSHKIDMQKQYIDVLCLPGHKGLMGPMGTGALLFSENINIKELVQGGTGSYSLSVNQPDVYPDRLESGTLNLPGIAGLERGISFLESFGGEKAVLEKESELINVFKEGMSVIKGGFVYDEMQGGKKTGLIAFNIGDLHSELVSSMLDKRGIAVRAGYHCSYLAHKTYGTTEKGCVRVSPSIFNSKKDIKNLLFSLNQIALSKSL